MSNSSDRGDRIWKEFHASLAFHVNTRPFCNCDACGMVAAGVDFTTITTDQESGRVRALFQNNQPPAKTGAFMNTTKHANETFSIRALPGCGRRDHFHTNVPDEVLEIITAAAVADLDAGGPPPSAGANLGIITHAIWKRVRAIEYAPHRTVEDALSRSAGVASPINVIESIVRVLLKSGDLEATLTAERARIDSTLAFLAKRHPAGTRAPVRRRRHFGDFIHPVNEPA